MWESFQSYNHMQVSHFTKRRRKKKRKLILDLVLVTLEDGLIVLRC